MIGVAPWLWKLGKVFLTIWFFFWLQQSFCSCEARCSNTTECCVDLIQPNPYCLSPPSPPSSGDPGFPIAFFGEKKGGRKQFVGDHQLSRIVGSMILPVATVEGWNHQLNHPWLVNVWGPCPSRPSAMPRWDFSQFRWNIAGFGRVSGSHQKMAQLKKDASVQQEKSQPNCMMWMMCQSVDCRSSK